MLLTWPCLLVGIIRTVVAELVPERELQPKAFSIMPLVWSIGSIFGPAFGGFFANPAAQFPGVFGNSRFFKAFPFALPNLMGSVIFMISMTTAFLFLKETAVHKRNHRDWGLILGEKLVNLLSGKRQPRAVSESRDDDEETTLLQRTSSHASHDGAPLSRVQSATRKAQALRKHGLRAVLSPQTTLNLVCYTFLALHSVAFDQLLPVFLHYPVEKHTPENTSLPFVFNGGFGLKSGSIGTIFTVYGLTCGLIQFLLYPPIATRFGILNCFKASLVIMPFSYCLLPFTILIEDSKVKFVALMAIMTFKAIGVIFAFPSSTILLTNSATSLAILATLNGLATTFSALGRAFGPAAAGATFSYGVRHGFVGLPWWMLGVIAMIGAVPAWWIVEGEGPSSSSTTGAKPAGSAGAATAAAGPASRGEDTDDSSDAFYDDTTPSSSDNDGDGDNAMTTTEMEAAQRRQRRRRASLVAARAQPREIVAQPEGQDDQPLFSTSARSTGSGARRNGYGSIRNLL